MADFIAHDDSITCINMVNDPLCFLTCSKDKKFKIWSMTCELIGEVNTQPSLQQIEAKPPSDWKFKVDWEKLKEEEILEVIEIFEKIGGEPVKFDEASILDENPIELSSKIELKKKPEKNFQTNKLSRYKPLEEIKKGKTENKDDNENTANIDDQNTQEIVKRINDVINPIGLEHGLYEMSKNLLDGNKIFIKDEELKNTNKDNNFYDMRYKKYGKNVLNPDSVKNSLMQDSKFKNPIIKALHGEKKSHKVKDKNHIIFKDTSKTVGTYIKQSDSSNISRMTEKVELPSIAKNKKAKLNK